MKKLLLTGVAALLLATEPSHAGAGEIWRFNSYKRCTASTEFKVYPNSERGKETDEWPSAELMRKDPTLGPRGGPAPSVLEYPDTAIVIFDQTHLAKLEAAVRFLKKCHPCFWNRSTGKSHCLTPKEMKELDSQKSR